MKFYRRPPAWAILTVVLFLGSVALAATQKAMPDQGIWRVVTLYLHQSSGASASGSISTDGNSLVTDLGLDVTGAVEFNGDVTLKGNGIDLLFDTTNQNTIGSATKGAKLIYTRAITNETSSALNITGASGITLTGDVTITGTLTGPTLIDVTAPYTWTADQTYSGNGVDLLFNAQNQNTIGASDKGAKAVFTRAVTGETGTALTITGSSGIGLVGAVTVTGSVAPEADGTRSLGAIATRFAAAHLDSIYFSPVTSIYGADHAATVTETFLQGTGALAEADITLLSAVDHAGRLACVFVSDTTNNNVLVKSAAGKLGTSAAPNGAGGVAAATGVTASADGSCGCWVANGTDWDLVFASGSWAAP
jgi:hypothetical protein